ncbi:MAG TPA: hypothetical protein VKA46_25625 [Gemmataceae bacterium]|nr:hypothetical protein [Gemmataceae bacterium]
MTRWVIAALVVGVICAAPLAAAEPAKKPVGTWTKKEGETTITFRIKADGLTASLKGEGDRKIEVTADYGTSKDGVLFARVSKITKNNIEGGPEVGDLFSFHFKVEKDKLVISELNSPKTSDEAKKLVEGDYEKEKDKKDK